MVFFISKASFTRASKKAHVSRNSARKQATQVSRTALTSQNYTTFKKANKTVLITQENDLFFLENGKSNPVN